jgi:hypothetical protein
MNRSTIIAATVGLAAYLLSLLLVYRLFQSIIRVYIVSDIGADMSDPWDMASLEDFLNKPGQ